MTLFCWIRFFTLTVIGLSWTVSPLADTVVTKQDGKQPLTVEQVQEKIQFFKDKESITADLKNRIVSAYIETQEDLQEIQRQEAQGSQFKNTLSGLSLSSKQLAQQIQQAEKNLRERKAEKFENFPTDEIEQRLVLEKSRLSDLDSEVNRVENQIGEASNRPQIIREQIAELKNRQGLAQQELQALTGTNADQGFVREAKQVQLDTRIRLANVMLKTLELENISAPIRTQMQKDQLQLLKLQREFLAQLISDLDNSLTERRQQEINAAQTELAQAEKEAEGKPALIKEVVRENVRLNRSLQQINRSMEEFTAEQNKFQGLNKRLEDDFKSAQQKISLAGLSPALGNILREQRRNLPNTNQLMDVSEHVQNEIALASLEMFKIDEAKRDLSDVNAILQAHLSPPEIQTLSEQERFQLRTELRILLTDQKELLDRLSNTYVDYARLLGDVDFTLTQLRTNAGQFSGFLDQRLLWVPSAPTLNASYLHDLLSSLTWLLQPGLWTGVIKDLAQSILLYPLISLSGCLLVLVSLWLRKYLKNGLYQRLKSSSLITAGFDYSFYGLGYLLGLSVTWPLLIVLIARLLWLNRAATDFSHALSLCLVETALSLLLLQFSYRIFRPGSVAEKLFHWPQHLNKILYEQLRWWRFMFIPCIFLTSISSYDAYVEHSATLGRAGLIIWMLAFAYTMQILLNPNAGVCKAYYAHNHNWLTRMRYVWYGLVICLALLVVGCAVVGYYQSALEISLKLVWTLRLFFITAVFHTVAQNWLSISRRRLALHNMQSQRKQLAAAHVLLGQELPEVSNEPVIDLSKINQQSHKLLSTLIVVLVMVGLAYIWSDILPAFSIFDTVELWRSSQMIEGKMVQQPVTLANLLFCLLLAGLTGVLVSNFPALVDLFIVERFSLTAGARYAFIQLVRYVLVAVAFLAIADQLGGNWEQVQWLVAALGFGLGFGLQEIFANLISGIILLFERPIRVGDTVTVGGVTGRVSRIKMRATHIVDVDKKELVVPNKVFITNQLVNWTLSDTVTRVVVPISVEYGSDLVVVERALNEAVHQTANVLAEPVATINFVGLADNSLDFKIHLYVRDLSERVKVTHELLTNIYAALQMADITMPKRQANPHVPEGSS